MSKSSKYRNREGVRKTDRINELVGAWCLEPGNSKTRLAEQLGINRVTLQARINGRCEWKWVEVCKLADVLGVSLATLAGADG